MLKFTAQQEGGGTLYGFGLSETDLNRLEFNQETIFFEFDYAGQPNKCGLIAYLGDYETPEDIAANLEQVRKAVALSFGAPSNALPGNLHLFPIARSVMQRFRQEPFWAFTTNLQISNSKDSQMFFSATTEAQMRKYLADAGLIKLPTTERLAIALEKADCPAEMIARAREGYYDDFKSPLATPIVQLVNDLRVLGHESLVQRAINGEFDATPEESEAWYQAEGRDVVTQILRENESGRGKGKSRGFGHV